MMTKNTTRGLICMSAALLLSPTHAKAEMHDLKYYKELYTSAADGLKGNVKEVKTYRVRFTTEWGKIKILDKEPAGTVIYDNQGRCIKFQNIELMWAGVPLDSLIVSSKYGNSCKYIFEYDGQGRLISVEYTSPEYRAREKTFFHYKPNGGYTMEYYDRPEASAVTKNFDSLDPSEDSYIDRREYEYKYELDREKVL